jgi:hypothetical protein
VVHTALRGAQPLEKRFRICRKNPVGHTALRRTARGSKKA